MSKRWQYWILALAYVGVIYCTLSIAPRPLAFLRSHGILRLTLTSFYVSFMAGFLFFLYRKGRTESWRFMTLIPVLGLYFIVSQRLSSPEEQIHFFQYGLVGALFLRAMHPDGEYTRIMWSGAFILGSIAGWIDELIQGWLPNRHYDRNDIVLNALSVFLGLVVYCVARSQKK